MRAPAELEGRAAGRRSLAVAAVLAALLVALPPRRALAYCQTTLCDNGRSGVRCDPAQSDDCGAPLRWAQGCLGYSIFEGASKKVDYPTLSAVMAKAFSAWANVDCGAGAKPGVAAFDLGAIACDRKEYNLDAGNANVVFFHDVAWPYEGAGNTLALTTVTFNLDDASILDADLEINGVVDVTTGDDGVQFDLQSIVTHEAGHMLGLAHSAEGQATMFVQYGAGDTSLRTLHPDDGQAICASYPTADVSSCDPTPRRGLATICDPPAIVEETEGCDCRLGTAPTRTDDDATAWLAGVGALALGAARRHGRARRGSR